ncbi:MAG: hypothetical protein JETT_2295 [Candidatus Jettenia ecosi]|uniref:Uncharacterized protein n=1 Tax=Candidatus Jettenia ecosi TaxID=2494326 RepID=A0A533Q9S3_9BACT|nr:MAG: hypothetical protein JETT_2295 [Candidatus Jettenia ecosi]
MIDLTFFFIQKIPLHAIGFCKPEVFPEKITFFMNFFILLSVGKHNNERY